MSTKCLIQSVLLSLGLLSVASVSHAAPTNETQCIFEKYAPTLARQFSADASIEYGSYDKLKGALLYIPARDGLTRQWLELSIERALAQRPASKSTNIACNLPDIDKLQVRVASAGNGFWVELISSDATASQDVLKWATRLVQEQQHLAQAAAKR